MKLSYKFYLDNPKAKFTSSIFIRYSIGGVSRKVSIRESIEPKNWNKKLGRAYSNTNNSDSVNYSIRQSIKIIEELLYTMKINNNFNIDIFHKNLKTELSRNSISFNSNNVDGKSNLTFFEQWTSFIQFRIENKVVKKEVIGLYKRSYNYLSEFNSNTNFEIIDEKFLTEFRTFLINKKSLQINGTVPLIKNSLLVFLNWATSNGINLNLKYKNFKVNSTTIKHNTALTFDELKKLEELEDLKPHLENARRWMIILSYTGLRISDALRLNNSYISFDKKEVELVTEKTESRVRIPFIGNIERYLRMLVNKEIYKISDVKLNKYIKEVCKIAGFNEIEIEVQYKPNRLELQKFRYELISTRAFRKTFATLSIQKGISYHYIMKITGHKSLKSFESYIGFSVEHAIKEFKKGWES